MVPLDWRDVLTVALEVVGRAPGAPLLVIDELPYLLQHSPEITGFLQLIYDQSQRGRGPGGRIVLCGRAMTVMSDLLSGTKPLRGRAVLDLRLPAFDHRTSREHWQIEGPQVALSVDAVLGGAPGYRPLAAGIPPQSEAEFGDWVVASLLDPGRALYTRVEATYLLREDPRITHRTLYYDVLSAVARGASTPAKVGALLGRDRSAMVAPLELLEATGYLHKEQDLDRLQQIRDLLIDQSHPQTQPATLALYSLHGFSPDLHEAAVQRHDVLLVDVAALYGTSTCPGWT